MPKSSMASITPMDLSVCRVVRVWLTFSINIPSVSSSSSRWGGSPVCSNTARTVSAKSASRNCLADILTATRSDGRPSAIHCAPWRQASRSTQAPIGTIRPVSSANGTKRSGEIIPRQGCTQRNNASTPTIPPDLKLTWG